MEINGWKIPHELSVEAASERPMYPSKYLWEVPGQDKAVHVYHVTEPSNGVHHGRLTILAEKANPKILIRNSRIPCTLFCRMTDLQIIRLEGVDLAVFNCGFYQRAKEQGEYVWAILRLDAPYPFALIRFPEKFKFNQVAVDESQSEFHFFGLDNNRPRGQETTTLKVPLDDIQWHSADTWELDEDAFLKRLFSLPRLVTGSKVG